MTQKLFIPDQDFNDEDWQDPSISGWLTLYCIFLGFGILFGIAEVYQMPHLPVFAKFLGYLTFLLPIYSLAGIILRLRDAVAMSIASMIIFLFNNICGLFMNIQAETGGLHILISASACIIDCIWIAYFLKSKLVAVRFPEIYRKVFVFDWILIVIAYIICLMTNVVALIGTTATSAGKDKYQEVINSAYGLSALRNEGFYFADCQIVGTKCLVYLTPLDKYMTEEEFNRSVPSEAFRYGLFSNVIDQNPAFIEEVIDNNLNLAFVVYKNTISDGYVIDIPYGMLMSVRKDANKEGIDPEKIKELLSEIISPTAKENSKKDDELQKFNIPNVKLKDIDMLNEVKMVATFEVDESKGNYKEAYDQFAEYAAGVSDLLIDMFANDDKVVHAINDDGISIIFTLKGSKTGYTQDITVFPKLSHHRH